MALKDGFAVFSPDFAAIFVSHFNEDLFHF
jgi:hypothetical protein